MAGKGESKTSPRHLSAAEKQAQALELRKNRVSYDKIAEVLGYSGKSGAYKAVQSALKKTLQEPADELRALEGMALDDLQFAQMPLARKGHQGAAALVLKIMERRAKLFGLDAPVAVELDIDVEAELRKVGADKNEIMGEVTKLLVAILTGGDPESIIKNYLSRGSGGDIVPGTAKRLGDRRGD